MKPMRIGDLFGLDIDYINFLGELALRNREKITHRYFDIGALFWSLERLFTCYQRIVRVYNPVLSNICSNDTTYLENDIENYYIRHRILLNNIAFSTYQVINLFDMNFMKPRGKSFGTNNEISFFDLVKILENSSDEELKPFQEAYKKGAKLFYVMKDMRDNLIHFKAKAIVYKTPPPYQFSILQNEIGIDSEPIHLRDVFTIFNDRTKEILEWMDSSLLPATDQYVKNNSLVTPITMQPSVLTAPGVFEFVRINQLLENSKN